jgi:RNA polymerase sigma factor (sigma-70 family)
MSREGKRQREREELARVYDRLGPDLFRYAMVIVKNTADAQDVIQQVFTGLLATRPRVDSVERYLFTAVRNECLKIFQRHAKFRPPDEPFEFEAVEGVSDNPDERMAVERVLADLPMLQREVVYLKMFTGRTLEEIAEFVDESPNTIWARYRYAMDKLRSHFGTRR